jgi:hypothetical protein
MPGKMNNPICVLSNFEYAMFVWQLLHHQASARLHHFYKIGMAITTFISSLFAGS